MNPRESRNSYCSGFYIDYYKPEFVEMDWITATTLDGTCWKRLGVSADGEDDGNS